MANLGLTRKPIFFWQALLILLPVIAMAAIGWVAIVRDQAVVEQEARERALELLRQVATELPGKIVSQLHGFDAVASEWFEYQSAKFARLGSGDTSDITKGTTNHAHAYEYSERFQEWQRANPQTRPEELFPNRLWLDRQGQLAWPADYDRNPHPPNWLVALSVEQRRTWILLQQLAKSPADLNEFNSVRTAFLELAPPHDAVANADFLELACKVGVERPSAEAVAKFALFARQHARVTSESGIPVSNLAIAAAFREAFRDASANRSCFTLLGLLLETPSALTGELLEQAQPLGSNDRTLSEALIIVGNLWLAQERLREMAEVVLQSGQKPGIATTNFWIEATGKTWLCMLHSIPPGANQPAPFTGFAWAANPAIDLRCYPRVLVEHAVASGIRAIGVTIPNYADLAITLEGEAFLTNPRAARVSGASKLLAETQCFLAQTGVRTPTTGSPLIGISEDSEAYSSQAGLTLQLQLVNPELLFARQRQRTRLFEGLILSSALAALVGLLAAYRAFLRQLHLSEMQSNFVSSVSHELRAPIASVRLMAESLARGKIGEEPKQKEYYHFIVQECRRLSSLIENVLDFSRIEQGRKQYDFEPTDLVALTSQTVKLMETYAAERKVRLSLVLPNQDQAPLEFQPNVDGKAIQQALINLIDNALKHSPVGETVTVGLELKETSPTHGSGAPGNCHQLPTAHRRTIQLWIQDHGPGIPSDEHDKIFERFYRSGSELRRETQGVGIGLSIVKHIIDAHGGAVRVHSAVGEGSRFTIELTPTRDTQPPGAN